MLQQEGKYLFFSFRMSSGLDGQIGILEKMIVASLSLKRILVVKQTETDFRHKTSWLYVPFDWDRYIDLDQTKIAELMSDGTIREIKSPLRWVHEKDFNFKSYPRNQVRHVDGSQLYDPENDRYPLIRVLKTSRSKLQNARSACLAKGLRYSQHILAYYKPSYYIAVSPSPEVNKLTDIALNHFATDRQSSQYMQTMLTSKARIRKHDFIAGYYICIHVRTWETTFGEEYYYAMQKDQIKYIVSTVCKKHRSNIPIYIMSNATPGYFDFLKPKYNIYTYRDFPKLKELFATKNRPVDHNLLYAVESNIMRYALVKILPPDRNKLIFEGNASYETPHNITADYNAYKKEFKRKSSKILVYMRKINRRIATLLSHVVFRYISKNR